MIRKIDEAATLPPRFAFSCEVRSEWTTGVFGEKGASFDERDYAGDGSKWAVSAEKWILPDEDAVPEPGLEAVHRTTFDGHMLYFYVLPSEESAGHVQVLGRDKLEGFVANDPVMKLFGHAPGGFKKITSLLEDRGPKIEVAHEEDLLTVRATGTYGTIAVWVDPLRGHNIVRLRLEKGPNDDWYGGKLSDPPNIPERMREQLSPTVWLPKQRLVYELSQVRLAQFEGRWVPVEGRCSYTIDYGQGRTASHSTHLLLSEMELDPKLDHGHFDPQIPEGAHVIHHAAPQIPMQWQRGKPEVVVDEEVIDGIDQDVGEDR